MFMVVSVPIVQKSVVLVCVEASIGPRDGRASREKPRCKRVGSGGAAASGARARAICDETHANKEFFAMDVTQAA
jgi:hypothetical protein